LEHLYEAQKAHRLATTGPYAYVRHPQYAGFVLIMVGFLLQWPTFATLLMFPLLLIVYRKLAMREEREVAAEFGAEWEAYAADRPRFLPRLRELGHRPTARQDAKPVTEAKPALVRARVASDDTRRRRS
jgi:protein-S-isoprenylcysteine O-methyltransferase Ste14